MSAVNSKDTLKQISNVLSSLYGGSATNANSEVSLGYYQQYVNPNYYYWSYNWPYQCNHKILSEDEELLLNAIRRDPKIMGKALKAALDELLKLVK
ncbi:MAG: hypothetical protein KGJ90_03810 [Patescibacteria group bacterium]|nr:hypothetical protein [Patescibacteria group bacterium]